MSSVAIVKRENWLRVPKELVNESELRSDLTISNQAYWQKKNSGVQMVGDEPVTIEAFKETATEFLVPRHYEVPWKLGAQFKIVWKPSPHWSDPRRLLRYSTNIELRGEVQQNAVAALNEGVEDKILCLACGIGKTVCAIYALVQAGKFPVLIIVNTNALLNQWETELKKWIHPSGGGELRVGRVQGSVSEWQGCDVVLAMLHTIIRVKEPPEFYERFRLIVIDEVHRLGAQTFSEACPLFWGERWGLSATPEREDRMDRVVSLHLGKIAYRYLKQPMSPTIFFVKTGVQVRLPMLRNGQTNMGRLYTSLSTLEKRTAFILNYIRKAAAKERTILALGERREQLFQMAATLKGEGYDTSVHVGGMGKEEAHAALQKQVVFATQHIAKEGLDQPTFDTIFIFIPFGGQGRLQQTLGRILRWLQGKKDPVGVVFVDDMFIMEMLARKMKRACGHLGFKFKEIEKKGE